MGNEFWAAIAGALVGGVISGAISYLLQRQSLASQKEQLAHERIDRQRSLARSFVTRLAMLHSHVAQLDKYMKDNAAAYKDHPDPKPEAWQSVRPLLSVPAPMQIPTEEFTLLLELKLDRLFNRAVLIDEKHNTAVSIFEAYFRAKDDLKAVLAPYGFTGDVAHLVLTAEQLVLARPKMIYCNQLAAAMADHVDTAASESWELLSEVGKALSNALGLKLEFKKTLPEQEG